MCLLLLAPSAGSPAAGESAPAGAAESEVRFFNGDVELAGTLVLPAGPGPHPAIVYLHGSGPMTREGGLEVARRFSGLGLAGLAFDKRGTGGSSGDWTSSSLADLARDGVAAIELLKGRSEIDPGRIGFWGVSQAGWVAAEATAYSDDIGFLVITSGGGVAPRVSERYAYAQAFERHGLPPEEVAEGLAAIDAYMRYMATGEGRAEVAAAIESAEARKAPWYELASLGRILPATEAGRRTWSWVGGWDPAERIATMRFPVLLLFGGRDTLVPTDESVAAWRRGLERAGNTRFQISVFPEAGHGIRMWGEGHHGDGGRPPFAEGYWERMTDWLEREVVNAP